MVPDELAPIALGQASGLLKAEKCPDRCLRHADGANLPVNPDVDEGVGSTGSDRIVFHGTFLRPGELPN